MSFLEYLEYIEDMEANRYDAVPMLDREGMALTPVRESEPGSLFDDYREEESSPEQAA